VTIGAAVFFPLSLMDPLSFVVGGAILLGILAHDKKLVMRPQMEPLL